METYRSIEVPENTCKGKCTTVDDSNRICDAGIEDNYAQTPDNELATPSAALTSSSFFNGCSAGTTNRFDHFIDNRCFGHTFSRCIDRTCAIKSATLRFCLRAANVPLTSTDSVILGTNGVTKWGRGLPALSGTSWSPGTQQCWNLTLDNLPGNGYNIIPDMMADGDLDFVVQDDTAVDFVNLDISYEDCKKCEPTVIHQNTFTSAAGEQVFPSIEECDCFGSESECKREKLVHVYYPGTKFEVEVDVGRCAGVCPRWSRCTPEYSAQSIEAPAGTRSVRVVKSCACQRFWTPIDAQPVTDIVTKVPPSTTTKQADDTTVAP